ncbi:YrrS family protein [Planococcus beigongshangi]|uniref:YrrS family protein n=1 Tax=Planococcus beigongshangi TaxID=2782536 RepID=UPI00193B7BB0|nr:YrrS family protein [Planococcus beigongshangi]
MAEDKKPYPSRVHKKNRSTSNTMLNVMIGLVFALILIVGAFIFLGQSGSDNAAEPESVEISTGTDDEKSEEDNDGGELAEAADDQADSGNDSPADTDGAEEDTADSTDEQGKDDDDNKNEEADENSEDEGSVTGGTITRQESNDPVVKETIINTSWEPVGTEQSGEHVSVYDMDSVDWKEKIAAIEYATGMAESEMYIMHIGNGGSPQKSVGTVQSKDMSKKYRIHLEWVEKEGWKPVKMDILNTVEGAY